MNIPMAMAVQAELRKMYPTVAQAKTITPNEIMTTVAAYHSKIPPVWKHKIYQLGTNNNKLLQAVTMQMGKPVTGTNLQRTGMQLAAVEKLASRGKIPLKEWNPAAGAVIAAQKTADSTPGQIAAAVEKAIAKAGEKAGEIIGPNPLEEVQKTTRNIALIALAAGAVYVFATLKPIRRI